MQQILIEVFEHDIRAIEYSQGEVCERGEYIDFSIQTDFGSLEFKLLIDYKDNGKWDYNDLPHTIHDGGLYIHWSEINKKIENIIDRLIK